MGLGPTFIGAIIGAAVGVGLHQFLEVGLQIEARWFAIVIGLLTGLGVRQATKSHSVSYARGAIAGLVALGAIVGSMNLVSVLMAKKEVAKSTKPLAAVEQPADDDAEGDDDAEAEPAPKAEPPRVQAVVATGGSKPVGAADQTDAMQFAYMAIGALLAYVVGRGSGATAPAYQTGETPEEPMPRGTDPSE